MGFFSAHPPYATKRVFPLQFFPVEWWDLFFRRVSRQVPPRGVDFICGNGHGSSPFPIRIHCLLLSPAGTLVHITQLLPFVHVRNLSRPFSESLRSLLAPGSLLRADGSSFFSPIGRKPRAFFFWSGRVKRTDFFLDSSSLKPVQAPHSPFSPFVSEWRISPFAQTSGLVFSSRGERVRGCSADPFPPLPENRGAFEPSSRSFPLRLQAGLSFTRAPQL